MNPFKRYHVAGEIRDQARQRACALRAEIVAAEGKIARTLAAISSRKKTLARLEASIVLADGARSTLSKNG